MVATIEYPFATMLVLLISEVDIEEEEVDIGIVNSLLAVEVQMEVANSHLEADVVVEIACMEDVLLGVNPYTEVVDKQDFDRHMR